MKKKFYNRGASVIQVFSNIFFTNFLIKCFSIFSFIFLCGFFTLSLMSSQFIGEVGKI